MWAAHFNTHSAFGAVASLWHCRPDLVALVCITNMFLSDTHADDTWSILCIAEYGQLGDSFGCESGWGEDSVFACRRESAKGVGFVRLAFEGDK